MAKDVFDEELELQSDKTDKKMMEAMESVEKSVLSTQSQVTTVVVQVPPYISPEWQDYVLNTYLRDDEKFDGLPTNAGLRRAAEDILGGIIEITPRVVSCPSDVNNNRAVVECTIVFYNGKRFTGCADSYDGNTDAIYRKYPVSIAETRAENRALRKALRLSIVSKDEISEVATEDRNSGNDNPFRITESQIKVIDTLCKRAKINVAKLIESTNEEGDKEVDLNKLGYERAVNLIKLANEYVQAPQKIPTDLLITQEKK